MSNSNCCREMSEKAVRFAHPVQPSMYLHFKVFKVDTYDRIFMTFSVAPSPKVSETVTSDKDKVC